MHGIEEFGVFNCPHRTCRPDATHASMHVILKIKIKKLLAVPANDNPPRHLYADDFSESRLLARSLHGVCTTVASSQSSHYPFHTHALSVDAATGTRDVTRRMSAIRPYLTTTDNADMRRTLSDS